MNLIGAMLLILIALVAIAIGVSTLRRVGSATVPSLSRTSQRLISRHDEPVGFWTTMGAGLIWLLLGTFLLVISVGGALGFL